MMLPRGFISNITAKWSHKCFLSYRYINNQKATDSMVSYYTGQKEPFVSLTVDGISFCDISFSLVTVFFSIPIKETIQAKKHQ